MIHGDVFEALSQLFTRFDIVMCGSIKFVTARRIFFFEVHHIVEILNTRSKQSPGLC